jgi:hypothetical protein
MFDVRLPSVHRPPSSVICRPFQHVNMSAFPWPVKSLAREVFSLLHRATSPGSFWFADFCILHSTFCILPVSLMSRGVPWMLDVGCWMLDVGCWMLDVGCWMLDVGCWMLDVGCWMLDVGCWMLSPSVLASRSPLSVVRPPSTVHRPLRSPSTLNHRETTPRAESPLATEPKRPNLWVDPFSGASG